MTTSRSLKHRAPLLWVLLPFMAGLVAGRMEWLPLSPAWWAWLAAGCCGAALAGPRAWAAGIVTGTFLCGATFYEIRRDRLPEWDSLPPREARVTLEIDRVFPRREGMRTLGGLGRIVAADAHLAELPGQRVYFSVGYGQDEPPPVRSSRLSATGMLQPLPRNADSGTFDGYLAGQGINFRFTRARVTGDMEKASVYQLFCDAALARFNSLLALGVERHPQQIAVLRGMLLGQQQELGEEQKRIFRESGTMHLFSISGLHIAVIATVIHGILSLLRLPSPASFVCGGILLWLYVDITGTTPSAVRAFFMVMFLHASRVFKLPGGSPAALTASALCVLLVQPMQLFTASFQLSYGIVASLLLFGLPLADRMIERTELFARLPKVSWRWWHHGIDKARKAVLGSLAIGLSTTVVSLICGVVIFHLFTPVSLPANLVIIPFGTLAIISGFLALVCGLLGLGWLAELLNHASVLVLVGIEHAVRLFVELPGACHAARFSPGWLGYAAFAGLLGVILAGYAMRWEPRRGGFWTPLAFTALVLAAGMRWIPAA